MRAGSSKSYVFSPQPFIEMATVLPHAVLVISEPCGPNLRWLCGEVERDLEPDSEVVMPSATRRNALMNKPMASAS